MGVLSAPFHSAFVFDGHHNLGPAEKARTGLLELLWLHVEEEFLCWIYLFAFCSTGKALAK
jgi:hypothetical protein